jgi:hypothetical protein
VVICLPLVQRFSGLNLAENDGFLRPIVIRSTTYFGREVEPLAHVVRFYGMLKIPAEYDRDTSSQNSPLFLAVSPDSLLGVCW